MLQKKLKKVACGLLFFLSSCSLPIAFDPMSYAPDSPNSAWVPYEHKSEVVTSRYCQPIVPKDFGKEKLTLAELIDIALVNSPITKKSWAEAKAAAANYGKSLHDYFPSVDFEAHYHRYKSSTLTVDPNFPTSVATFYQTIAGPEVTLTYTLFDFGQRKYSSSEAMYSLQYADWSHNRELQTIIQIVMNDYYSYQSAKEKYTALEQDLADASTALDAAVQKFQNGIAAVGDVVQAKTKYLQTKIQLTSQKDEVETDLATLTNDIGLPANIKIHTENFPEKVNPNPILQDVDLLIAKAQKYRQDYFAATAHVRALESGVYYAKAQGMPRIDTQFDIGKNYFSQGMSEDYHFSALIKLSFPLFKGFLYKNQERMAFAKLRKAKALLEQTELAIAKDVTTANFHVKNAADNVYNAEAYLEAAQERFSIALSNYKVGTATILDVLSAQSSLADARAREVKSKKDWFMALASLAYATGTLGFKEQDKTI